MTQQEFFNQQQKIIQLEQQVSNYNSQIAEIEEQVEVKKQKPTSETTSRSDRSDEIILKDKKPDYESYYLPRTPQQKQAVKLLEDKKALLLPEIEKEKAALSTLMEQLQQAREAQINQVEQQKNQVETKLTRVKDLILEKRWNTLQQLVKEGKI